MQYQLVRDLPRFAAFRPKHELWSGKRGLRDADELAAAQKDLKGVESALTDSLTSEKDMQTAILEKSGMPEKETAALLKEVLAPYEERLEKFRRGLAGITAKTSTSAAVIMAVRCRWQGCRLQHRTGRETANGLKQRRGRQAFCKEHAGLRRAIGRESYEKLFIDPTLQVASV